MASNRTVYYVVPDASGEKWLMTQGGSDSTREVFQTKAEAIDAATHRARHHLPSKVEVHKSDGNMEYESTYGEDPGVAQISSPAPTLDRAPPREL